MSRLKTIKNFTGLVSYAGKAILDREAITTSVQVAELFGKAHKSVLRKIDSIPESTRAERKIVPSYYIGGDGAKTKCYTLGRDSLAYLIMGFTGKKAEAFKWAYIDAFNAMDNLLAARSGLAEKYTAMSTALKETMEYDGKIVQPYMFSNEARLINSISFGNGTKLDRDKLSPECMLRLDAVEKKNIFFINRSVGYTERKDILLRDFPEPIELNAEANLSKPKKVTKEVTKVKKKVKKKVTKVVTTVEYIDYHPSS